LIAMGKTGSWVALHQSRGDTSQRLFCFPHAGGGATAYRRWVTAFPGDLEVCPVQLPGREQRLREPPFNSMEALLEPLLAGLLPWLDRPFSFFGHSMGAAIAFELAHRLRAMGLPTPQRLLVSGRRAPGRVGHDEITYHLPDDAFLDKLAELNGSPREVLDNAELMALMLPMLRADFQLIETYRGKSDRPLLDCPLTAFGGVDDPKASREDLLAWKELSRGPFRLQMFAGGHFYLQQDPAPLLEAVQRELTGAVVS